MSYAGCTTTLHNYQWLSNELDRKYTRMSHRYCTAGSARIQSDTLTMTHYELTRFTFSYYQIHDNPIITSINRDWLEKVTIMSLLCLFFFLAQGQHGLGIMIIEGKHAEVGQGIFVSDIQEGSAAEQVCPNRIVNQLYNIYNEANCSLDYVIRKIVIKSSWNFNQSHFFFFS